MGAKNENNEQKRKRRDMEVKAKKRPRVDDESDLERRGGSMAELAEIDLLAKSILESKKNFNNITILIERAKGFEADEIETATRAIDVLCRIFCSLLKDGHLTYKQTLSEKETVRLQWLRAKLSDLKGILTLLLLREDEVAPRSLKLAMELLRAEGEYLQESYVFPKEFLGQIVRRLIQTENTDAPGEFLRDFVDEYDDVRYFTHQAIK
jgi:U3 small nucleolar RNA-associated protein 19